MNRGYEDHATGVGALRVRVSRYHGGLTDRQPTHPVGPDVDAHPAIVGIHQGEHGRPGGDDLTGLSVADGDQARVRGRDLRVFEQGFDPLRLSLRGRERGALGRDALRTSAALQ
jgi:hypothetical protein